MGTKRKSISESLAELINPTPASFDPEDDIYTDTVAKVVGNEDNFSDDEERVLNKYRKRNIDLIEEEDERYHGAKISRKALKMSGGHTDEFESGKNDFSSETEISFISGEEDSYEDHNDSHDESEGNKRALQEDTFQHISRKNLDMEVEKGNCVTNQLSLWDNILECRIQFQKALISANKLPQLDIFQQFISQGGPKFKAEIQHTKQSVTFLLEKLISFQTKMLNSYPETKHLNRKFENENTLPEMEEESCSDTEEKESSVNYEDNVEQQTQKGNIIKHNLEHFTQILADQHTKYMTYRNATIQKWNDKTRVLTGKLSSCNFSNFEQSTLKQIEQILNNRQRLIQRSQLKRSSYNILGHDLSSRLQDHQESADTSVNTNDLKTSQEQTKEYNAEIYDDTDYYQQLLRELIERKSTDVTDPVQLGRQWLELQKLRSKMKRKIDTRATKGRKIRYDTHPKLVNFMAPVSQNLWNEEAKTELFSSLFGKKQ